MDQPLRARRGLTSITQPESSSASFASTIKQDSYSDNISSTTNQNGNKFTNGAVQEKLSASSRHRAKPSFIESLGGGFNLSKGEGRILAGLILLGSIVRFYRIDRPASVV
jgi:dolichyl-phosphate-mannose-protein mannosyltransferase